MTQTDVLKALDDLIQTRSILKHPFYVAWQRGELTRAQLAVYARAYYPHVAGFPSYLSAALEGADDDAIRAELSRNLADELSEPKPHPELWRDFAEELGVDRDRLLSDPPARAATETVDTFARLASESTACALAALYAYESQQPGVSSTKIEGLRHHYGIHAPRALRYFEVHAAIDTQHCQAERDGLGRCLDAGAPPEAILNAAAEALDAYWGLLDGVVAEAKIEQVAKRP